MTGTAWDITAREATATGDNVRVETYDIERVREQIPRWDELPKPHRKRVLHDGFEPESVGTTHNITTEHLWTYISQLLNDRNEYEAVLDPPEHIVFSDDPGPFNLGDDSFVSGSNTGRIVLTDPRNVTNEWRASELVGALELRGLQIESLGVETESGNLWNLTELPAESEVQEKTTNIALIVEVIIPVNDATFS